MTLHQLILAFTALAVDHVDIGCDPEEIQLALLFAAADGAIGSGANEEAFTLLAAVVFRSANTKDKTGDDLGERIRAFMKTGTGDA